MSTENVSEPMVLPIQIRLMNKRFRDELAGYTDWRIFFEQMNAKRRVKAKLRARYTTDASLRVTPPIATFPLQAGEIYEEQIPNQEPFAQGIQKGLVSVGVTAGIFTDQWEIKFTNDTGAFSLTGHFTRAQGTGTVGSGDFESDNGYITILNNDWIGIPTDFKTDDSLFFITNNYHPYISFITVFLTTGYLIGQEYTPMGNANKIINPFVQYAEGLLDELADPNSGVGLETAVMAVDDSPVAMPYDIGYLGNNLTEAPDRDNWGNYGERWWPNQVTRD